MRVDFYHLTRAPLDRVLPVIAERVVAEGGRLLIVAGEESKRAELDRLLWNYAAESFLPHGCAGTDGEADQPVLIAGDLPADGAAANGARAAALADGRWRDGALRFDRAFHFFDADAVPAARLAWKALAGRDGVERRYWRQDEAGRWEQAA